MPKLSKQCEVAIIGTGPAGLAAAIQLKRGGIKPLVLEGDRVGGLLNNAYKVENYLGFPKSIDGAALAHLFQEQAQNAGVTILHSRANRVSFRENLFHIKTSTADFRSEILVVASGTKPRKWIDCHITGKACRRIYYEVCPIRHVTKKRIVIIGGGDAAFDYALTMARKNKVTILNRSGKSRSLPVLRKLIEKNKNITYVPRTKVSSIKSLLNVLRLHCSNKKTISTDYLLVAIGREPNLDFLSQGIIHNTRKLARQKKLYIIGDARHGDYRQTAIAAGDGIRTAMEIAERMTRVLRRRGDKEQGGHAGAVKRPRY